MSSSTVVAGALAIAAFGFRLVARGLSGLRVAHRFAARWGEGDGFRWVALWCTTGGLLVAVAVASIVWVAVRADGPARTTLVWLSGLLTAALAGCAAVAFAVRLWPGCIGACNAT